MFQLPVSTLRYYDKEGLFPHMKRTSGIRQFSERELESLRVIECLKKSGLEIKDIKIFMQWCEEGSSSYSKRLALFQQQKTLLAAEIAHMERVMDMLEFKCWYYETAIKDGSEDHIKAMIPDHLPPAIQEIYNRAHTDK